MNFNKNIYIKKIIRSMSNKSLVTDKKWLIRNGYYGYLEND